MAEAPLVAGVLDLTFLEITDEQTLCNEITEKSLKLEKTFNPGRSKRNVLSSTNAEDDLALSPTRRSASPCRRLPDEDTTVKGIRLSNNIIRDMRMLVSPLAELLDVSKILWLDLSFNDISAISPALATAAPNLTTLYLHANKISKLSDIKKLSSFENLKSLTLYGNPVEEKKHYKKFCLYYNTKLTHFDSSPITKDDKMKVSHELEISALLSE